MSFLNRGSSDSMPPSSLTRRLLLFSRKQKMQRKPISLNELTSNLTKMPDRVFGEDIKLEFNYENHLPSIQGDARMLEQVILNLAVNARDAMPQGGSLHISTGTVNFSSLPPAANPGARPGTFVKLVVRDTGTGIPPEVRERIFEPFFTMKEVGKGRRSRLPGMRRLPRIFCRRRREKRESPPRPVQPKKIKAGNKPARR